MVRRTKEDVLAEFPPKMRLKVRLELTPSEMGPVTKQQQVIAALEKATKERPEGDEIDSLPSHEIMKIFKLLAEAKQGAVCDWLHTSFFDEQAGVKTKVLIFAHHKCVHEKLAEFFKKQLGEGSCGDSWVHITGETSPSERSKQLDMFKSADRCRFAVLALTACGSGLNLDIAAGFLLTDLISDTIADTCIFAELCWTPSALNQAESRIHRMGQQARRVLVYYLVAGGRGSPNEIMFNALATKSETVSRVVDHELDHPSALRDSQLLTPKRKRRISHVDEDETAANTAAPAAEEADGGGLKELLDVPWITRRTGVDLIIITILGIALGLISVPYCAGVEKIPELWLEHFGPPGLIDNVHNLSFCAGSTNWILLCWGFCTVAGALKASLDLDKYPSFIDELKHQHSDPIVSLKVVTCCIASLAAGAVMGLEAGLGSVGGALGYLTFRGIERCMPSEDEGAADLRRRTYILAGLAAAFGTILPAPFVAMILVAEIASAGTERHASEDEFMTGRRLPRKVLAFLVPAATASFVMRWAIVATPLTNHPYYAKPYDNLSVFLGLGLGLLAAAAALIFVLIGAIIKVIFGLIGSPLERRLGKRARQLVLASLAGLITGVATFMYPLAISSGKSAMEPTMKFALFLTTADLLGAAVAKCVAYWACAHGGLVGGIFFPLLYYGLTLGEVCAKVFNISRAVAVPVMLGAVPGALLPAPLTALSFPVGLFVTGPVQTVPILVAIVTASMLLVGSGFLEKLMVKRA
eukprot:s3534_g9.t2